MEVCNNSAACEREAMIKSLILVRHAKTEPRSPEIEDHQRQLTSAGIRSAKAALPRALSLVENPKEWRIWSSPALRAWQTAEIVADAMGLKEIEKNPNLYSDEVHALRKSLAEEKGNLVLVGHNPYLEEFADSICPHHLRLNKSSVACFTFEDGNLHEAELSWFVQGPDSSRWESLVQVETAMQRAARRASAATWTFFDEPKDPAHLHEVREALRNCLTLLDFVEPYLKKKQYTRTRETIDAFLRDTSELRKLAIPSHTAEQWSSIPFVTPEAQRMYDRLRILEAERNRIFAKLQTPQRQKAFHEASQALRSLEWKSKYEAEGIERAEMRRRFKKLRRDVKEVREKYDALPDEQRSGEGARKLEKLEARFEYLAEALSDLFAKDVDTDDYAL